MASELKIPFDIPDVEVLSTKISTDKKIIITVESQVKTIECGICHQAIMDTVVKSSYGICQFWGWKRTSIFIPEEAYVGIVCTSRQRPRY